MPRPTIAALQAFRRVVELHSFRAAAASLQLTGGAVSKLVAQLERALGARLLHRTTRTVTVSAEGSTFYEAAVRVLDELDAAGEALRARASAPSGRLKVSVPTSFAWLWLSPRLPAFVEAHPALEVDLALNDRYVDLVQEGFDCAIRITARLADSTLVARPLGLVERWLVAAPAYLDNAPPLDTPEDLDAHACLGYSQGGEAIEWPLAGTADDRPVAVATACRVNNSAMLRDLLLAGLGVTLTPAFVVDDLVRDGRLVERLDRHRPEPLTVWGVVAHSRYIAPRVRAFLDFVATRLAQKKSGSDPDSSGASLRR
jgi:DNA-binding transcriptional LysR family regulator